MANMPQTIKNLVAVHPGAALVYADGIPQSIKAPNWSTSSETEMSACQQDFFLKWQDRVPNIPLKKVLYSYDCIAFMSVEEAQPWLPVWMCASFYAMDVIKDSSECVIQWTTFALVRCLKKGRCDLPVKALQYYATHVSDGPKIDSDLFLEIDKLLKQSGGVWYRLRK